MKIDLYSTVPLMLAMVLLVGFFTVLIVAKPMNANAIRVACVGDSNTHDTQYTADLASMLGNNYTVGNFGVWPHYYFNGFRKTLCGPTGIPGCS